MNTYIDTIKTTDPNGEKALFYPRTKQSAVEGLEETLNKLQLTIDGLKISSGESNDAGTLDVTDKITPNPDITFTDLKYEAIQIGNAVFLTFTLERKGGTVGTMYDAFSIDESILPNTTYANIVYGAGGAKNAVAKAKNDGFISFDGGGWGQGSIQWFTDASTTEIDKTTGGELKPWLYSEEEILIGVYEGKPLYRKVFLSGNISVSKDIGTNVVSVGVLDNSVENCVKLYGNAYDIVNAASINFPYSHPNLDVNIGLIINSSKEINLVIPTTYDGGTEYRFENVQIVAEYTKTTDAEGSGNSLTPYGIFNAKLDGIETEISELRAIVETLQAQLQA